MSLSNPIRVSLSLPNIDIFTFGESNLYGYDSLNHSLVLLSLNELNKIKNEEIIRLYLTSEPKYSIEKLILNQDETIIALVSHQLVSLVYLPQIINSPSKPTSHICPLNEIPASTSDFSTKTNRLIDFLWLSSTYFLIVNSLPSSSECHLYKIQTSKVNRIEYIQTYSIGLKSMEKRRNRKISLNHPSDIVKLNLTQRKQENSILNLVFALKSNGDIYLMEIDENQLINNFDLSSNSFVGPIRIFPSRNDNYGADYSHSKIYSLSYLDYSIVFLIRDKCQINQMILLNPQMNNYSFYTIDSIQLLTNDKSQTIDYLINDQLYLNKCYLSDSLANIYSMDLFWIDQLKLKLDSLEKTHIQHLIQLTNQSIQQLNLIQIYNKGQWLAIITKTSNHHEKEIILFRPYLYSSSDKSLSIKTLSSKQTKTHLTRNSSEFLNRIRLILKRTQSLPQMKSPSKIFLNNDFQENLCYFIDFFSQEYLDKQQKVRIELENKQKYLFDFQQTQTIAYQELNQKFQQIQINFQSLFLRFQQESKRQKDLKNNVDDLLAIIEERTPVLSDAEMLMYQQLQTYQIHINLLREKIFLLQKYLSNDFQINNQQQQQINQSFLETSQKFIAYFSNQIQQMKQQLQTIQQNH